MRWHTSSASSSSAGIVADIFRLIVAVRADTNEPHSIPLPTVPPVPLGLKLVWRARRCSPDRPCIAFRTIDHVLARPTITQR